MALNRTAVSLGGSEQPNGLSTGQPASSVNAPDGSTERIQLNPEQREEIREQIAICMEQLTKRRQRLQRNHR